MRILRSIGALWLVGALVAAKDGPEISITKFDNQPKDLFFFDDTEIALTLDSDKGVVYRTKDAGGDWDKVGSINQGDAKAIHQHPSDNKVAVVLGRGLRHWITDDQGKTWRSFETSGPASRREPGLVFHWSDSKRMLFNVREEFDAFNGIGETWYTTDAFKTLKLLHDRRKTCTWAKSTDIFTTDDAEHDKNRILCVVEGKFTPLMQDYRLLMTDDYFKTTSEPTMSNGRSVNGMTHMATVKGFIVAAAKAQGSNELALYVTHDTNQWHRAEFGDHRIEQDAYTVLESTNYSIQVQVQTMRDALDGVLFSSNSNGTYFTRNADHISRNTYGMVDFEKIQGIQGIYLVNVVDNWEEVESSGNMVHKKLKTKITFDDGRTFESLRAGNEDLHLHSVTDQRNTGRIFSSLAPGLVMGNGNAGEFLSDLKSSSLYVSDDAGKTWTKSSLKGPQKYEFGDQGSVLVAVPDVEADEISYSLNHGREWKTVPLGQTIRPYELTTIPDATSLKFILTGYNGDQWYSFGLDFEDLHKRKCGNSDFEDWYARKDDKDKPKCVMGHTQYFRRRKADADCFVDQEFKEPLPQATPCECADEDFECDFNFRRSSDRKECELVGRLQSSDGQCKNSEGKFQGSSGWRLIAGNNCKRSGGKQKDDKIERSCNEVVALPPSGDIKIKQESFPGGNFISMYYLERDPKATGDDETIVFLTDKEEAWTSHDHGKTWKHAVENAREPIVAIYPHQYNNDYVYFITPTKTVYYSQNRAKVVHSFEAPDVPNIHHLPIISFHQRNPDWILWTGDQDCQFGHNKQCRVSAHVSKKNGAMDSWEPLMQWVRRCQFMYREGRAESEELTFCEHWEAEDTNGNLQLLTSDDLFETYNEPAFGDVVDFATMAEFIVVAAKSDKNFLEAHASIDGRNFAHAAFPPKFEVEHEQAYTVLDSSTNAIFLHVTVSAKKDGEYGTILKSNSNGTSYVVSANFVNRNTQGYVDFEKMQGLEGVATINVVSNVEESSRGSAKKLKSMITHDDGSDWAYIPAPEKDLNGEAYKCDRSDLSKCSLHLHSYTERKDPRDTFSSPSAVGLMIGVGNVGEYLTLYNEGDTFLTKDGGINWKPVMKGTYMWEYGDQGSVIVLVQKDTPTTEYHYTIDEGETWIPERFSEEPMLVERITTVPSDNSRNFLLWGKVNRQLTTVNIDFTGLTDKQCNLNKENPDSSDSDYVLWSPTHPLKNEEPDCLFGHQAQYYRKKPTSNCYNGPLIERLHDIVKNCSCTRQDFECDYNFERQSDGTCRLVDGLEPADADAICKLDPTAFEYYDITGYRKIPLSTCSGGRELEYSSQSHPCPGHEDEFQQKRGISGIGLFFAIVIPIGMAAGVGYYVWSNWDGKFGRIRLGDSGPTFTSDSPWISYPVTAISAIIAIIAAIPLLVGSLWRSATGRFGRGSGGYGGRTYTSRSSFARGRGEYDAVDNDEGELLGEDSDEDV